MQDSAAISTLPLGQSVGQDEQWATALSRRTVIGALLALPACLHQGPAPPVPALLADAHSHLFNLADLPVEGFLRHVILPNMLGSESLPPAAGALIDLVGGFYQSQSRTASSELAELDVPASLAPVEVAPAPLSASAASRISDRATRPTVEAGADTDAARLDAGYRALAAALTGLPPAAIAAMTPAELAARLEAVLESITVQAEDGEEPPLPAVGTPEAAGLLGWAETLVRTLAWASMMTQRRRKHLETYAARYTAPRKPVLVVNHLVDFENWLNDAPRQGSDIAAQERLWARLARGVSGGAAGVRVATFTAFCPLRHAIERLGGPTPTLDRQMAAFRSGDLAGFKLYPPMGFRSLGNAGMADASFVGRASSGRTALARYRAAGGAIGSLGSSLDAALRDFYGRCVREGAPLMAHGGLGNAAGEGFGERANPRHWETAVAEFPLRLSIGHLVNDARQFVAAAEAGPPYPDDVWALHASRRLLGPRPADQAQVYGDLAYMPELIADSELARRFFVHLRTIFGAADPALTRILYGTDWVMLGRERRSSRFAAAVLQGMKAAEYGDAAIENIMHLNAERFVGRHS